MTHKLITLPQAVARFTCDGMQYASGAALPVGADAVVFGRELIRQNRRQLHAIFHSNTQQLNLLCAAGAVDKLECGFTGLEGFGFANGLRRAVESLTRVGFFMSLLLTVVTNHHLQGSRALARVRGNRGRWGAVGD